MGSSNDCQTRAQFATRGTHSLYCVRTTSHLSDLSDGPSKSAYLEKEVDVPEVQHLVYFPLENVAGRPLLRIMQPADR
jgi:hypothetical protein